MGSSVLSGWGPSSDELASLVPGEDRHLDTEGDGKSYGESTPKCSAHPNREAPDHGKK
jgi:hypothetical protein